MSNGWDVSLIPSLQVAVLKAQQGTYAQCLNSCGAAFHDDIPRLTGFGAGSVRCPECGHGDLRRGLQFVQLHPLSEFRHVSTEDDERFELRLDKG